jgi:radical SAM protein with 4Fe4S-binding SPASM domain
MLLRRRANVPPDWFSARLAPDDLPEGPISGRSLDVLMDQTNSCNLRCRFCGMSDPRLSKMDRHDMPLWLFEKIAKQVFPHAASVALSVITEPLLVPDFGQRLQILSRHDVPTTELTTNGMLLTEALSEQIIETSLSRIAVSIDGAGAETHERMRPGSSLLRILGNIRTLSARKKRLGSLLPALRLKTVLTRDNVDEFDQMLELAESLEVDEIDVLNHIPMRGAVDDHDFGRRYWNAVRKCKPRLAAWSRRTGIQVAGFLRGYPSEIRFDASGRRLLCRRPWTTVAIPFNGDVQPCMTWMREPIGNLARQDFAEIWNGPVAAALRREFVEIEAGADCRHCAIKKGGLDQPEDGYFLTLTRPPAAPANPR